nr:S layer related protein (Precursor) [Hymenolepis microstoma]
MTSKLNFTLLVLVVAIVGCSAHPVEEIATVSPEVPTDALPHIKEDTQDDDVQITTGKKKLEEAVTEEIEGTDAPASEKYKEIEAAEDEDKDEEGATDVEEDKDEGEGEDKEEDKKGALSDSTEMPLVVVTVGPEQATTESA